jgi:hypothetical protein
MIFFSYSRADAPLVEAICEGLSARHVDIWLDRAQLRVGEPWLASIASAIERSESVIVVSSQYSVVSPHVQWEHHYAVSRARKPVDVVQIDNGPPQLVGSTLERFHDLRHNPLDVNEWPPIHGGGPTATHHESITGPILPSYVHLSGRASVALLTRLIISLSVLSLFGLLGGWEDGNRQVGRIWTVYAPVALMVAALLAESRRVYLLRRRRLVTRQNPILKHITRAAEIVACLLLIWIVAAAFIGTGIVLVYSIVNSIVELPQLPDFVWILAGVLLIRVGTVLYGRLSAELKERLETGLARALSKVIVLILQALPSYDAYETSELRRWLPAYVARGRRLPSQNAPLHVLTGERNTGQSLEGSRARAQLWFAQADRLLAVSLRRHLRTSLVDLRETDTTSGGVSPRGSDGADLFLCTRYSRRCAGRLRARDRLLAVVTIGDSSIPDEVSDLHCIDASELDLGAAAEAISDTLLTGAPAVPTSRRDRRASFLRLPSGVFGFLVAYLAMQSLVGYELVLFSALEGRAAVVTSLALLTLTAGWIPLVIRRRSALGLAIACTTAVVLIAAVVIVLRGNMETLAWLTIPVAWCVFQHRTSQRAKTKGREPGSDDDPTPRDIDIWTPSITLKPLEWIMVISITSAGLATLPLT